MIWQIALDQLPIKSVIVQLPLNAVHGSCLTTFFFKGSLESIQKCETEVIELPATEKAENLGYGVWLVTSATKAYTLYETTSESNSATGLTKYPGCNFCIITLAW